MNESRTAPITVETTISKSTYFKLNILMAFNNWAFYLCLIGLAIVTYFMINLSTYSWIGESYKCASLILWGIFIFYAGTIIVSAVFMTFSSSNWQFFVPKHYAFDEEGITACTPVAECRTTWDAIVMWKVVSGHYLLYNSLVTFFIIPCSALPAGDVSTFASLLRTKIRKR